MREKGITWNEIFEVERDKGISQALYQSRTRTETGHVFDHIVIVSFAILLSPDSVANPIDESSGCFWPDVKSSLARFKETDVKFKACKSAWVDFHVETGFDKSTGEKSMSSIIPPSSRECIEWK